jgi:hypothetical protein
MLSLMDQSGVADVSMILTMSGGDEGLYLLNMGSTAQFGSRHSMSTTCRP